MNRRTVLRAGVGAATGAGFLAMPTAQPSPTRRRRADPAPWRVQILVFDGVDDLDIFAPLEVLGYATHFDSRAQVELVTAADPGSVVLMSGTAIDVRSGWAPHRAEVIVVPGGGYGLRPGGPRGPPQQTRGPPPRAAGRRPARRPDHGLGLRGRDAAVGGRAHPGPAVHDSSSAGRAVGAGRRPDHPSAGRRRRRSGHHRWGDLGVGSSAVAGTAGVGIGDGPRCRRSHGVRAPRDGVDAGAGLISSDPADRADHGLRGIRSVSDDGPGFPARHRVFEPHDTDIRGTWPCAGHGRRNAIAGIGRSGRHRGSGTGGPGCPAQLGSGRGRRAGCHAAPGGGRGAHRRR